MSNIDCIINSLHIANVIINDFNGTNDVIIYHISTKKFSHLCPCCGHHSSDDYDYRKQVLCQMLGQG